ncbi:hypothetical protein Drorol1_Dr00004748 [Drosera rotundifolia]
MDHPLQLGDFLVCRYQQDDSTFFIKIYGTSCCGKRTDLVANGRNIPPAHNRERIRCQSSSHGEIDDSSDSEDSVAVLDEEGEDHEEASQVAEIRSKGKRGRSIRVDKGNRALDAANRYISSSTYPNFTIIMTQGYLKLASMYVPPKFVHEYIKNRENLYLVVSGQVWHVSVCKLMGGYPMRDGWPTFVTDNDLQAGDVGVVELVKRDVLLCKVTIFRCGPGVRDD